MTPALCPCPWCGHTPVLTTVLYGRSAGGWEEDNDDLPDGMETASVQVSCHTCHATGPLFGYLMQPDPPPRSGPGWTMTYMVTHQELATQRATAEWNRIACRPWWVRAWRYLQRRKG